MLGGKVLAEQKLADADDAGLCIFIAARLADVLRGAICRWPNHRATDAAVARGRGAGRPLLLGGQFVAGVRGLVRSGSPRSADAGAGPARTVRRYRQKVLVTDGPTQVLAGTLDLASFRQIKHFELRCRNRLVGLLPVEDVPTSSFTAEGASPTEHFPWSHAAEQPASGKIQPASGRQVNGIQMFSRSRLPGGTLHASWPQHTGKIRNSNIEIAATPR